MDDSAARNGYGSAGVIIGFAAIGLVMIVCWIALQIGVAPAPAQALPADTTAVQLESIRGQVAIQQSADRVAMSQAFALAVVAVAATPWGALSALVVVGGIGWLIAQKMREM